MRLGGGTPSLFLLIYELSGVRKAKSEEYKTKEQAGRKRNFKTQRGRKLEEEKNREGWSTPADRG
ncbi:MAG: hypothetical protein U9N60_05485 [Thermodesulfobacteriota bacterium]|nr:hypothetical protein [Thermodesulfobacteriota bacterium]